VIPEAFTVRVVVPVVSVPPLSSVVSNMPGPRVTVPSAMVVMRVTVGVVVPVVSVPPLSSVLSNMPGPQVVVPTVVVEVRTMTRSTMHMMMTHMMHMMMHVMNMVMSLMSSDAGSSSSADMVSGASGVLKESLDTGNSSSADVDAKSVRDTFGKSSAQTPD